MEEFEKKDFAKHLKRGGVDAHRWMRETASSCARVYDRNLDGVPVTVDLYGPYARILDYSEEGLAEEDVAIIKDLVSRYLYIEGGKIIYKERKKREGRQQHASGLDSLAVDVTENGLSFRVELEKYVDTGLFLDQCLTRSVVRDNSMGLDVLNLFSYTGSFSVYAAAGGAASVTSVDLSNVYTKWAADNLRANGFLDQGKYPVVCDDAAAFIRRSLEEKRKWDLIIFDPPSFSNSHKAGDFDVKKDYFFYLIELNRLLRDNGSIVFSENLASFSFAKNRLKAWFKIREITDEIRNVGFTRKRMNLRVWVLEKVRETTGEEMKRISDDDSLERLSLSFDDEREEKRDGREERKDEGRRFDRRPGRGFSSRDRKDFRPGRGDERPRREYYGEERPGREHDRDGRSGRPYYERERRYYTGYSDERPGRDFDRPRRHDEDRRRYSDDRMEGRRSHHRDDEGRDSYKRHERDYDDRSGYRDRDGRPGRDYGRSERPERPKRYFGHDDGKRFSEEDARERRPRVRKAPVPYGYDTFKKSKRGDEDKDR